MYAESPLLFDEVAVNVSAAPRCVSIVRAQGA